MKTIIITGGTGLIGRTLAVHLLKKGNKVIVEKNLFKNRTRISIQKATTIKVLKTLLALK